MSSYFLGRHVFVRVLNGTAFFLDVRQDEYFCLRDSGELGEHVNGWPSHMSEGSNHGPGNAVSQLRAKGLLTTHGKTAQPADVPLASRDAFDEWRTVTPAVVVRYFVPFIFTVLCTSLAWWLFSLERNIQALEHQASRRAQHDDDEALRRLTGVFLLLRTCIYSAKDHCLFDSLVMMNFCNRCGCYPTFVIGIRTGPFGAHCWTQYGDCALNELDTRSRRYTAILAI